MPWLTDTCERPVLFWRSRTGSKWMQGEGGFAGGAGRRGWGKTVVRLQKSLVNKNKYEKYSVSEIIHQKWESSPGKTDRWLSRTWLLLILWGAAAFISYHMDNLKGSPGSPFWGTCHFYGKEKNWSWIHNHVCQKFHDTCQHTQGKLFSVLHLHDWWINTYVLRTKCSIP